MKRSSVVSVLLDLLYLVPKKGGVSRKRSLDVFMYAYYVFPPEFDPDLFQVLCLALKSPQII